MTAEQLEASRAERLRLNGHGTLSLEDARTWLEETGLCLFLPRKQFAGSVAPSFVEAVIGVRNVAPDAKQIAASEALLVRLENDGVAVRLNLQGQPSEQPDYVVAGWVLPYVYALRGDRDWRRTPQLTGSRQVSPLAIQTYKLLEAGEATIPALKHTLGREVSEAAVLRAITELWQQLRIIPLFAAPGQPARWQLLRQHFQKAIAEGASTSQVTAISVLASIYLQAVIAATMEEVELFLSPLTARSKVREVLRSLAATRQVHTIALGHAPHFYVAGTLPEFTPAPTIYTSAVMPASSYFLHTSDHEEEVQEPRSASRAPEIASEPEIDSHSQKMETRKPASIERPADRPRFSRAPARKQDRKPSQSPKGGRVARRPGAETRTESMRPGAGAAQRSSPAGLWGKKIASGAGRSERPSGSGSGNAAHPDRHSGRNAGPRDQRSGHRKPHGNSHGNGSKPDSRADSESHGGRETVAAGAAKSHSGKRCGLTLSSRQAAKKNADERK